MKAFSRKAFCAALAGLSVLGTAGIAQAVSLNPEGIGQVLIYPYYTVRDSGNGNAFNSLMSVVNHTERAKAVRVRFLEGKASQIVLDFDLFLSADDVWTTAIVPADNGGARLTTSDTSCTVPNKIDGQIFLPYAYQSDPVGATPTLYDRTQEGYVEIIEMGQIASPSALETAITHVENAAGQFVPANCGHADLLTGGPNAASILAPTGGLSGSMTLINPNEAQDVAYKATALSGFFKGENAKDNLWAGPGNTEPNLASVYPKVSTVVDGLNTYITTWPSDSGADPVSAVLMNESVYNEYVTGGSAAAKTEWLITMPTKRFYYDGSGKRKTGYKLFQSDFFDVNGACDEFQDVFWSREEEVPPGEVRPPEMPPMLLLKLRWSANIVVFNRTSSTAASLFHSKNRVWWPAHYAGGWGKFKPLEYFYEYIHQLTGGATLWIDSSVTPPKVNAMSEITFTGLPMLGFAVQQFNNGTLVDSAGRNVWASYAGRIEHGFEKRIEVK
jgi:hypothetical protein